MNSNPYQPQQNYTSYDHSTTNIQQQLELQQYGDLPQKQYTQIYTTPTQQQLQVPQEFANKQPINTLLQEQKKQLEFVNFNERKGFIFKVLSLITIQMAITFIFTILAYFNQPFRNCLITPEDNNPTTFLWICFLVSMIPEICILCCRNVARKTPLNYIAFITFTVTFSLTIAGICAKYYNSFSNAGELVLLSAGLSFAVTSALTCYAWTTQTDFTMQGGAIWLLIMVSLIVGFWSIFFLNKIWHLLICSIGIILYGFYLIYDLQLIIGGKKYELTIDDYLIGALIIYLDIIMIFLRILEILTMLFGKRK